MTSSLRGIWITFIVATALAAGCGGPPPPNYVSGPGMSTGRFANLSRRVSSELRCPEADIAYRVVESWSDRKHLYEGQGCGRLAEVVLNCGTMGCSWDILPRARAAFDLDCPAEELESSYLGDRTVGFSGCGNRITYVREASGWVANTSGSAP